MQPEPPELYDTWPPAPTNTGAAISPAAGAMGKGMLALGLAICCWACLLIGICLSATPSPIHIRQTRVIDGIGNVLMICGSVAGIFGLVCGVKALPSVAGKVAVALTALPVAAMVTMIALILMKGMGH